MIILSIEIENEVTFLRLFDNPLLKYLNIKIISCMRGCFRLFTKIIKRSGTSFCCIFSAWFFYKIVLYLIFHLLTKFHSYTFFPSQDVKQNVLLTSYFDSWLHHKTLRFILGHPLKQWPTGRKGGKDRNTKKWISL